jgi:hypothetical protein
MKLSIKNSIIAIFLMFPAIACAAPSMPHQFYGTVNFSNGPAPNGLSVEVKLGDTTIQNTVTKDGKYGYDPLFKVEDNSGTLSGKTVKFFVGGINTNSTAVFKNGDSSNINLTASGTIGTITKSENDVITDQVVTITPTNPTQVQMGDSLDVTISSDEDTTATIETVEKLENNFFTGSTAILSGNNLLNGYEIKINGEGINISVTLHYGETGIDPSTIKPYRFDGSTWVPITPFSINTSNQTVTFSISAANTPYVLFGQPATSGGGGGGGGSFQSSGPTNPSISINSAAAKTNSRSVALTLGATNAIQMAIANTADFAGIGWETYAVGKTWNLTEGAGVKTVYVKFRASSGAVSSVVSDTISYEPDVTINDQQGEVLGASTYNFDLYSLYQANGSPDVYAVINDVKRKIRSLEIFNSYNWAGGKIKPTTQGYLDSLPDANLIKTPDSPNVYILEKGFKRLLASVEIFDSYALNWNRIATINQAEMDSYANAPLIKHGPDLLWLDGNRIGHLFPSMESLTRHGYNTRDAIDINDLEFSSIGIGIEINN